MIRMTRFGFYGLASVTTNFIVFSTCLSAGFSVGLANALAFIAGGQMSFWVHDRITWGDVHPTLHGWTRRWVLFMPGNLSGLGVNSVVALVLLQLSAPTWLVYVGAMLLSGGLTFAWYHTVSHRERPTPPNSVEPD